MAWLTRIFPRIFGISLLSTAYLGFEVNACSLCKQAREPFHFYFKKYRQNWFERALVIPRWSLPSIRELKRRSLSEKHNWSALLSSSTRDCYTTKRTMMIIFTISSTSRELISVAESLMDYSRGENPKVKIPSGPGTSKRRFIYNTAQWKLYTEL